MSLCIDIMHLPINGCEIGLNQCWSGIWANAWSQYTISMMLSKNLNDCYQYRVAYHILILVGYRKMREYVYTRVISWVDMILTPYRRQRLDNRLHFHSNCLLPNFLGSSSSQHCTVTYYYRPASHATKALHKLVGRLVGW